MPYTSGEATSLADLLSKITTFVTDTNIHGEDAWSVIRQDAWPRGTIYKGKYNNNDVFIGIMLMNHVKGSSYINWLKDTNNLIKQVIKSPSGLNLVNSYASHVNGQPNFAAISDITKGLQGDDPQYSLYRAEIVNESATALAFGVFKQYNDGLNWDEQPGGLSLNRSTFLPIWVTVNRGSGILSLSAPIYPGVGYPGFGLSNGQPSTGSFKYWIIKDACRITVVINNNGQWDIGHAGLLNAYQSRVQYGFPAVMFGSNTGLRTVKSADTNGNDLIGDVIDYSYANWSLSRSMPCMATINGSSPNYGTRISQIAMCLPDGSWVYPYNWKQGFVGISREGDGSPTYFPVKPTREANNYYVAPMNLDVTNITSMEDVIETISGKTVIHDVTKYVKNNLLEVMENNGNTDQNILGALWNIYFPSIQKAVSGEYTIGGKKCLLINNCWDDRLLYHPFELDTSKIRLLYEAGGVFFIDDRIAEYKKIYDDIKAKYDAIVATKQGILDFGKQFRILIELEV